VGDGVDAVVVVSDVAVTVAIDVAVVVACVVYTYPLLKVIVYAPVLPEIEPVAPWASIVTVPPFTV
jgi:hypothetical protein